MSYDKRLSSLKILSLLEQKLCIGRVEITRFDNNWAASSGFRRLLGLTDMLYPDLVNLIVGAIHVDDRVDFLQNITLMYDGFVPPTKVFRIVSPTAAAGFINLQFEGFPDDKGEMQSFIGIAQDISQEVLLSQARHSAAERVDVIMQALNVDCFWRKNKRGEIFDYSARGNLRRQGATILGRAWAETIRADQRERVLATTSEAMSAGIAYAVSVNVIGEDGSDRAYLSKGFPLKDENGHIVEWCGVVSEQSAGEAGLDVADAGIAHAADVATGVTVRALCAFFGWTYDEAANRSALSVTTINRFVSSTGRLVGQFKRKSVESTLLAFFKAGARFYITNDRKLFICREE